MNDPTEIIPSHDVTRVIRLLRDQRVILDTDLAAIYGVQTRALNQAVKRNQDRFPADFMFELSREEILGISQSVISLGKLKFSKQARVRHIVPKLDAERLLTTAIESVERADAILGFWTAGGRVTKQVNRRARKRRK